MTSRLPEVEIAQKRSKWRDLMPRILSAIVMIALGLGAILQGHAAFRGLVLLAALIGLWELSNMLRLKLRAFGMTVKDWLWLLLYTMIVIFGALGLLELSYHGGRAVLLYAIALVITSDSLGYLVGKAIGGPKFWPKVSPKKTWAGIVGGWVGVGALAALCHQWMPEDFLPFLPFVIGSVLLAFASQMGDMLESALKRRMGVKDSSHIIPGHGGVLDRFDALLAIGALYFFLAISFG
ncbi:phosphatidate cytidylyltransferase [Celeribacter litoreus]|uniref:phosphatidate cytidylyltransferase n=1 Tax=Celeribacter litoreus TaxID=2876714 RepID=UPI001CCC3D8B|nr:phosphatidate cytidylyltransferase [Celeribacter litoreus]MCA0043848.1 phosphatidate cytidylyltransferase [Celeribacter litoreus]